MTHACDVTPDGEAHRRLLDMLAGWHHFVEKVSEGEKLSDEERAMYQREAQRLHDLYQEAGRASCPTEETLRTLLDRAAVTVLTGHVPGQPESADGG